jgi:hypothetical protein
MAVFDFTEPKSSDRGDVAMLSQIFFVVLGVAAKKATPTGLNLQAWVWESNGLEMLKIAKAFFLILFILFETEKDLRC